MPIMMIEHSIFAWSNAILSDQNFCQQIGFRGLEVLVKILSEHMGFCSIIWSVIGLINYPDGCKLIGMLNLMLATGLKIK